MPINFFKHIGTPNAANINRIDAPEVLKDFVEGIYLFKTQDSPGRQLFFNDGYPVIVLMEHCTGTMQVNINGSIVSIGNAWVCGGLLKNIYCESAISSEVFFVIRFHPGAFFRLFHIRENIFGHRPVFNLEELAIQDSNAFIMQFYACNTIDGRIEAVTQFLSRKTSPLLLPELLTDLLNHVEQKKNITVKELAQTYRIRLNYKWLERNFQKYLGLSPKDYLLLKRFLNTYRSLYTSSSGDLLTIALENGYCDENHLIKDFRSFSGQPPKAFFGGAGK